MRPLSFSQRLKGLRDAKGLLQEQIADACDVAVSTVSRWEEGSMDPRRKSFRLLAQILEVSSSYLNGEVSDLENLDIAEVAQRESFRLFAEMSPLTLTQRRYLERLLPHGIGPRTVAEWKRFSMMLAVALETADGVPVSEVSDQRHPGPQIVPLSTKQKSPA
jgi:transcriptional regulator with XRE-family HTH domain